MSSTSSASNVIDSNVTSSGSNQQFAPTNSEPPSVFVFNVGRTRTRQINDGPWEGHTLLEAFIKALETIRAKGYIVQGAMYGPEGVNIFIDTEDEDWYAHVNIH